MILKTFWIKYGILLSCWAKTIKIRKAFRILLLPIFFLLRGLWTIEQDLNFPILFDNFCVIPKFQYILSKMYITKYFIVFFFQTLLFNRGVYLLFFQENFCFNFIQFVAVKYSYFILLMQGCSRELCIV